MVVLFSLFSFLLIHTAATKSVAYDEIVYAPTGLLYWENGLSQWNAEHPPLQKLASALPWLPLHLKLPPDALLSQLNLWTYGYLVYFNNTQPANKLLFLSRFPSIVLTCLLGIAILLFVASEAGLIAGLISLLAVMFDPLILANGALAMNDIFVTTFFAATFLSCWMWIKKEQLLYLLLMGFTGGLAIASKFSGILVVPAVVLIVLAQSKLSIQKKVSAIGLFGGLVLLTLLASYHFNVTLLKTSLKIGFGFHSKAQMNGFLLGPIPPRSGWFYYPIVLLIKTPLPLLCLWILSTFVLLKRSTDKRWLSIFGVPVILILTAALISKNHFGIRYMLPMVPCLAVLIGFAWPLLTRRESKYFLGLFVWLAVETLVTHPNHMAYFNELIGGSKKGYLWLDGSNQDWGQDLWLLGKFWEKQNKPSLLLSYVGSGRPEAWGITYQDVFSPATTSAYHRSIIHPFDVSRELFAVSANLRAHPDLKEFFEWLNHRTPMKVLGNTIFVYDISTDIESVEKIGQLYSAEKNGEAYERQLKRAAFLKQPHS